jgi:hypothetical protein
MVPVVLLMVVMVVALYQSQTRVLQDEKSSGGDSLQTDTVSFAEDVLPILQKECLPCHAAENFNPSELSLDSYELLMEGGRNGDAVVPGDADESSLVQKILPDPPFGSQMPIERGKKKGKKPVVRPLSEEEIRLIVTWVEQGGRDN